MTNLSSNNLSVIGRDASVEMKNLLARKKQRAVGEWRDEFAG
jgi:hypothetical protein